VGPRGEEGKELRDAAAVRSGTCRKVEDLRGAGVVTGDKDEGPARGSSVPPTPVSACPFNAWKVAEPRMGEGA
jgi:hypothetical protein